VRAGGWQRLSVIHNLLVPVLDRLARPLGSLRISVTDRCNLRCQYCMPEEEYVWLPREDILQFEEIVRLARVFASAGVRRLRITGGEPLLRRNLPYLVGQIANIEGIDDLALTTNGVLLRDLAEPLRQSGLHRVTVSLDTLRPDRFRALTRFDELPRVLGGLEQARSVFDVVKIDSVIVRGTNDDEVLPLLEYARGIGAELRFIEYMDVGGATRWSHDRVVSRAEILRIIETAHGAIAPMASDSWAPADRFSLPDGATFGVISSTTAPFCRTCDRSRLTADGLWFRCLYAREGTDLRALLRSGASDATIRELIEETWSHRDDRGAELRAAERDRSPFIPVSRLRRDPHLEMHTRGG
jgi:cyclic pyranopterin phosphate synthase